MNSRFDALRDAIPGPSKLKSTRAGILAAAVSHIQQLEAEKAELKARLEMSSDETITQMDTGTVHNMATEHQWLWRTYPHPATYQAHAAGADRENDPVYYWPMR